MSTQLAILWVAPLPINSRHQDSYIFSRGSQTTPFFGTFLLGTGTTQVILLEDILHHMFSMKTYENNGIFTISTGDRRISEPSTILIKHHSQNPLSNLCSLALLHQNSVYKSDCLGIILAGETHPPNLVNYFPKRWFNGDLPW